MVFDYNTDFLPAFLRYQKGEGPRPSPQVIIAIGQNFRVDSEPYTNLLLSITVCHPVANHLLAQVKLAGSLCVSLEHAVYSLQPDTGCL